MTFADAFLYELHSSWWASYISWNPAQKIAARYYTWKTLRKWKRYQWSIARPQRIEALRRKLQEL